MSFFSVMVKLNIQHHYSSHYQILTVILLHIFVETHSLFKDSLMNGKFKNLYYNFNESLLNTIIHFLKW